VRFIASLYAPALNKLGITMDWRSGLPPSIPEVLGHIIISPLSILDQIKDGIPIFPRLSSLIVNLKRRYWGLRLGLRPAVVRELMTRFSRKRKEGGALFLNLEEPFLCEERLNPKRPNKEAWQMVHFIAKA